MSSAAAANSAAFWRIAGMSYLSYANKCGEIVRQSLKEPFLTQVRAPIASPSRRSRSFYRACTDPIASPRACDAGQGSRDGVLQVDGVHGG